MDEHENFPARARAARKSRKLTQAELAELAAVSTRTVSEYENGGGISPRNEQAILRALGLIGDADAATFTRAAWPGDVDVFLNMLGAYLMTVEEGRRLGIIHDLTAQIFARRN
jgi:transcriptional regulator with XRE-family HTH domain